jgi:cytochrome P450
MTLPPGPRTPRALQMYQWVAHPIPYLARGARRFGPMFTARFVIGDLVLVSDPALIKEVFRGDADILHAGEANAPPLEPIVGRNSVLTLDGPEHMRQRKLMLPSFHGERIRRYGQVMEEIAHDDIDRWPVGVPFGLRDHTQAITLEVIMRTVFGVDDAARLERLRDQLSRILDVGDHRFAMTAIIIPRLRRTVGRRVWERFVRLRDEGDELIYDEIRRRRADPATPERDDVLSIMLQARDEDDNPLTDQELRDELMTLLVAGHETTGTALAWTFDQLLHNPEAMSRLRAEIDAGESDAYLDAVIKETLRIRPVVPGISRKLTRSWSISGYELPAGTRVSPNIWLTHHNPDVFPEPERFRPERFLENPADTYSWIPFGGGIRRCLGASFALFELKTVIPAILRRVELSAEAPQPERIRRRAVTFAPQNETRVIVERRHPRPASEPGRLPAAA